MNNELSKARGSDSRVLGRLVSIVLALGMVACDRDDLNDGPDLKNDESVGPAPCEGDDCETPPELPAGVQVKINELMVENTSTLQDENGDFPPWIEIHNLSDLEFSLAGVTLSDSLLEPDKWAIPDIPEAVIGPFGFLIVFADGDEDPDNLHANFTLAPARTTLVLSDLGGDVLDLVAGIDLAGLSADESLGRFPDGASGRLRLLEEPTPGESNAPPAGAPPPPQQAEFIRGDVDENGRVNVSDMVGVQLILAGERPPPACEDRADANDDGVISDADPVAIGNLVFRQQALPAPYPTPGADPTPDDLPCEVR